MEKRAPSKNKLQENDIITLQEAIEYVDHELLTNRFHVTHRGGCAVLFNKDTLFPDVKVKSIYLHDTRRELPDKVSPSITGFTGRAVTCLFSSTTSQRPKKHSRSCRYTLVTFTLRNGA